MVSDMFNGTVLHDAILGRDEGLQQSASHERVDLLCRP